MRNIEANSAVRERRERLLIAPPAAKARVSGVVLFPAPYAVGMASLAVHTLYTAFNDPPRLACERAFAPSPPSPQRAARTSSDRSSRQRATGTARLRQSTAGRQARLGRPARITVDDTASAANAPLACESGRRLAEFDFIALTSSYELDWPAIPALLAAGGVSPRRQERQGGPLVIAGGPAITANPLPLAEIYDAALMGEIEPVLAELQAALALGDRAATLQQLAAIPGFYVPAVHGDLPPGHLPRRCALQLNDTETASVILTPDCEFPDRYLLEVGRGCGRSCTYCLARQIYRPVRWRSVDAITRAVGRALAYTSEVGLVAAAVSDHPQLPELCSGLAELSPRLQLSTSSLRLETASLQLLSLLAQGGQRTVTFAPEAGTERLRAAMGKALPESELVAALDRALTAGLTRVRLYFMVGLPGETAADREAIVELTHRLSEAFPALQLRLTLSAFSPRPHTPWENEPLAPVSDLRHWLADLSRALRQLPRVQAAPASAREAALQCAFSRADERGGEALLRVAEGATWGQLRQAFRQQGLPFERLLGPQDPASERPWKVVATRCWDRALSP